ncbi:hypothetical protein Q0601_07580 [Paracoccus onubensis]|uniref:hypothetical protein n=1 Tax=Paracoccus onubensis TaxID=1675788 RepID=UPI00272FD4BC|nr:hypothetical protein [Paracoccus onubensis]MDP0927026.1 hypothetical protein [Paracoccus onubensis]
MISKLSVLRQDAESYESIEPIQLGMAKPDRPEFVGDMRLRFSYQDKHDILVVFDWISTAMCFDEVLLSEEIYPYLKDPNVAGWGLYEIKGSSYLNRVGDNFVAGTTFKKHRHYIYFDRDLFWHITARGIEKIVAP